jgi:hypothetical protein
MQLSQMIGIGSNHISVESKYRGFTEGLRHNDQAHPPPKGSNRSEERAKGADCRRRVQRLVVLLVNQVRTL